MNNGMILGLIIMGIPCVIFIFASAGAKYGDYKESVEKHRISDEQKLKEKRAQWEKETSDRLDRLCQDLKPGYAVRRDFKIVKIPKKFLCTLTKDGIFRSPQDSQMLMVFMRDYYHYKL